MALAAALAKAFNAFAEGRTSLLQSAALRTMSAMAMAAMRFCSLVMMYLSDGLSRLLLSDGRRIVSAEFFAPGDDFPDLIHPQRGHFFTPLVNGLPCNS